MLKILALCFGQRSQLWWDVPPDDSFYLLRDIYKIPKDEFEKTRKMLIKELDIADVVNVPTRQLSLGQRMRCEIAAALLHRPKILFLDEPTIGLDAVSKVAVRNFIKTLNRKYNTTVILTTHDMQDIEALTNRIILIGRGKVLYDGNLENIRKKYSSEITLDVTFEKSNRKIQIKDFKILEQSSTHATIKVDTNKYTIQDAVLAIGEQVNIKDIQVKNATIEDVIAKMYKDMNI